MLKLRLTECFLFVLQPDDELSSNEKYKRQKLLAEFFFFSSLGACGPFLSKHTATAVIYAILFSLFWETQNQAQL